MTEIPEPAIQAAAEVLFRHYESEYSAGHLTWRDFADPAREVLEAAAPVLAEHVAQAITAHMEAREDEVRKRGGEISRRPWRRHFGIAARIAAGAFYTREDKLRLAAETLNRGDYMACPALEDEGDGRLSQPRLRSPRSRRTGNWGVRELRLRHHYPADVRPYRRH